MSQVARRLKPRLSVPLKGHTLVFWISARGGHCVQSYASSAAAMKRPRWRPVSLHPAYRSGRDGGQTMNVDRVAGAGAEGEERPTLVVGSLHHRTLQAAVDDQLVTLGRGEVLDGE